MRYNGPYRSCYTQYTDVVHPIWVYNRGMPPKTQTSIRLSRDAMVLRKLLSHKLGISQADVIEMSIRRLAELEHVTLPKPKRRPAPKRTGTR
jgi:hypothetical protein